MRKRTTIVFVTFVLVHVGVSMCLDVGSFIFQNLKMLGFGCKESLLLVQVLRYDSNEK